VAPAAAAVAAAVGAGGVVLLPTETFYGLAVSPWSAAAVARVRQMKGRPQELALPVLCGSWIQVEELVQVPEVHRERLERLWPGPVTAVLSARRPSAAAPGTSLAVRLPGAPLLRALLRRTGPLTGTSANRHGAAPHTTARAALDDLLAPPDVVLDGDESPGGLASTLVDLRHEQAVVLRRGAADWGA
jgi:L-threonylcarbamoyladenylate synthase